MFSESPNKMLALQQQWKSERFGFILFWISNGMNGKLVLCTTLVKEQTDLFLAMLDHISKEDLLHISSDCWSVDMLCGSCQKVCFF